jgi:hypothetical protein
MPTNLPYLPSYKNVGKLFEKVTTAKTPDAFTQQFLATTLGITGSGDRALITILKTLGFLDPAGKPTHAYSTLKNPAKAKVAIADAIRKAYRPLFEANEQANKLSQDDLKGLVAQVAGTDTDMTARIVGTLNALMKQGDFDKKIDDEETPDEEPEVESKDDNKQPPRRGGSPANQLAALRPDFHFNIQVHLPANATEEAYLSIFTALRKAFQ